MQFAAKAPEVSANESDPPVTSTSSAHKGKRRQSLVEFYQNDSVRRSISGGSVQSKDGNYSERWEWEDLVAVSRALERGEEFLTISRHDDSHSDFPPLIDVFNKI